MSIKEDIAKINRDSAKIREIPENLSSELRQIEKEGKNNGKTRQNNESSGLNHTGRY